MRAESINSGCIRRQCTPPQYPKGLPKVYALLLAIYAAMLSSSADGTSGVLWAHLDPVLQRPVATLRYIEWSLAVLVWCVGFALVVLGTVDMLPWQTSPSYSAGADQGSALSCYLPGTWRCCRIPATVVCSSPPGTWLWRRIPAALVRSTLSERGSVAGFRQRWSVPPFRNVALLPDSGDARPFQATNGRRGPRSVPMG